MMQLKKMGRPSTSAPNVAVNCWLDFFSSAYNVFVNIVHFV
jgi:hypothetical protein